MNTADRDKDKRTNGSLFYSWLLFAVLSLILAGVFAFLAAMTRTPVVQLLPSADYFRVSLVTHVTFSVTVWLMCFASALWVYFPDNMDLKLNGVVGWTSLALSVSGSFLLIFASLAGLGEPVLIDYIPLLDHWVFFAGLLLFGLGVVGTAVNFLAAVMLKSGADITLEAFGLLNSALITIVAFASVFIAWTYVGGDDLSALMWGPGHVLQFSNALNMVVLWFAVIGWFIGRVQNERRIKALFGLCTLFALSLPLIYLFPVEEQRGLFTAAMGLGLGVPSVLLGLFVLSALWKGVSERGLRGLPWGDPAFSSLPLSMALFLVGGLIAMTIGGYDTRVPAHYHGAIGAVTMVFMGATYRFIPQVGRDVLSTRWARVQPYLYGVGLLGIVIGLYWAGSYGAPRKAYTTMFENRALFVAMNLMGVGAVIAVVGGAAYVANAGISLMRRRPQ